MYWKRDPDKLNNVPGLMEKYKGEELHLYRQICLRYELDPEKFYAEEPAKKDENKGNQDFSSEELRWMTWQTTHRVIHAHGFESLGWPSGLENSFAEQRKADETEAEATSEGECRPPRPRLEREGDGV